MTVFIYVNTAKQIGDKDHIKVFASVDAAETWFQENDPEGWRLNTMFSNESDIRLQDRRFPTEGRQLRRPYCCRSRSIWMVNRTRMTRP